ncbi:MAG: hypothetical protein C4518_05370 [Desulfobacteraceae bacterium]|nr:MAG: hypothetical protein C4518_05370 [Desulfobacteraceae bacterium]
MMKLKVFQALLMLTLTLFCGCYFTSHEFWENDKPLVMETRFFLNHKVAVKLPVDGAGEIEPDQNYWKLIYGKWENFEVGEHPISSVHLFCEKYVPEPYDLCTNTLKKGTPPQENILYVSSDESSDGYTRKFRFVDLLFNSDKLRMYVLTSYDDELLPDKALQKYRMDEDDNLFEKVLDTILIEAGGKWIKPPVVRVGSEDIAW